MSNNEQQRTRPIQYRALISTIVVILFTAMLVSGLVLYLAPAHGVGRGRYEWAGLSTLEWASFHTSLSLLCALACLVHLGFNWRQLVCYIRRKREALASRGWLGLRREFGLGVALSVLLILAALFDWPPVSAIGGLQGQLAAEVEPGGQHLGSHREAGDRPRGRRRRGGRGVASDEWVGR